MKGDIRTGGSLACGPAKCLCRAGGPVSRRRPAGAATAVLFLLAAIIALLAAGGCTETAVPARDQPASRFKVYFNNDGLSDDLTVCDAVFPVPRASVDTGNGAAAALEALFRGPTPEERSQGYRSFFSERTAGLLKGVKIKAGTAYVDLHDRRRELAGVTSSCGSAEFFSQIRRTLAEYPGMERIIFAIEGNPAVFYDWMELDCDRTNDNCAPGPFASP